MVRVGGELSLRVTFQSGWRGVTDSFLNIAACRFKTDYTQLRFDVCTSRRFTTNERVSKHVSIDKTSHDFEKSCHLDAKAMPRIRARSESLLAWLLDAWMEDRNQQR